MKSGFVQLIVKNRLANKPINLSPYKPRYQPVDSFRRFINDTLPKMEESIEIQLLKKNLTKIESTQVRKELINSYLRRLFRLRQYEKDQIGSYKNLQETEQQPVLNLPNPTIFKQINQHSEYDIGNYIIFSNQDFNKVFKHGSFGNYSKKEFKKTNKFGIQIRKEGLGITNLLTLIQQSKKQGNAATEWDKLQKMGNQEFDEYINDQKVYPLIFNDLSNYIFEKSSKFINMESYNRTWRGSVVTDVICHTVIQNIPKINTKVLEFVDQVIADVNQMKVAPSAGDFAKRAKQLPCFKNIEIKDEPVFFSKFYFQTPSFKNVFLGGNGGSGKSMVLAYVAMWAYKNNWILINVPSGYKWTNDRAAKFQRAYNGLYLIHEHSVQWLDQFMNCNKELLATISICKDKYGQFDITGTNLSEYEPVPNLWDERRKVHFNKIEEVLNYRMDVQTKLKQQKQAALRITDVCPEPKTVEDIILAGINNPQYSTCAIAEVLAQVYNSQKFICELVDGFSHFYRPCWYRSFKYFNDRGLYGYIPPYHIAHCRIFMHLDGNKIKNGFKAVASSNYPLHNHKFDISQLMFPAKYEYKVPHLQRAQFQKAAIYNILSENWAADEIQRANIGYAYSITQGNWGDFGELTSLGHYY